MPSASPGNTGEESRPADAWTFPTLSTNPESWDAENAATARTIRPPTISARRWRRIAARAASMSIRRPPVTSSRTSQIGSATANHASPGML